MELSRSLSFSILGIFGLFFGTYLLQSSEQLTAREIKIAALLCLSGECAEWGQNSLNGMELAVEEINSSGGLLGKEVKLIVEDTQEATNVSAAVRAYRKVRIDSEVRLILGPTWSPAGLALAPIIGADQEVIATSPSLGMSEYNEAADNIFNVWPHDDIATRKLARYAYQAGIRRAAIFSSQQPWEKLQGDVFEEEFTAAGGQISAKLEPLPDANDLKVESLRIFDSQPELVFFSITNRMGLAARELTRLGYVGSKLAVLIDDTRVADAQGALEGCVFVRYPEAQGDFQKKYFAKFNQNPGITADTAYDALWLYAHAIQQSESLEIEKLKALLPQLHFEGASGTVRFDKDGGVQREPGRYRVAHGNYVPMN